MSNEITKVLKNEGVEKVSEGKVNFEVTRVKAEEDFDAVAAANCCCCCCVSIEIDL